MMAGIGILLFLLGGAFAVFSLWYFMKQEEKGKEIIEEAKKEAGRMAKVETEKIRKELEEQKKKLHRKENELLQREQAMEKKIDEYKKLLSVYELKLQYINEFFTKLRRVCFNDNRDAEAKVQQIRRMFYNFKE